MFLALCGASAANAAETNFVVRVPRTYDARIQFHQVAVLQREEQKEESHVYVHPQGSGLRGLEDPFGQNTRGMPVTRMGSKTKNKDPEQEKKDHDLQKAKPGMDAWDGLARDVMDRSVERDSRKKVARRDKDDAQDDPNPDPDAQDEENDRDLAMQDEPSLRPSVHRAASAIKPADSLIVRDAASEPLLPSGASDLLLPANQLSPVLSDAGMSRPLPGAGMESVPSLQPAASLSGLPPGMSDMRGLAPVLPASSWSIGDAGGGSLFGGGSTLGSASPMLSTPSRSVFQQDGAGMQPAIRQAGRAGNDDSRKTTLPW